MSVFFQYKCLYVKYIDICYVYCIPIYTMYCYFFSTQAHSKYVPLNKFLQHHYYVPYYTLRGSFKVKRPVSGAKMRFQYISLAHICYVDISTYCCVCITLLQVRIAVVHNSNIWGVSLKVNAPSCWKYPLHQPNPKPTWFIVLTNAKVK